MSSGADNRPHKASRADNRPLEPAGGRAPRLVQLDGRGSRLTLGGKADSLDRLAANGLPVPRSVCVPAEILAGYLTERGFGETMGKRSGAPVQEMREAVLEGEMPPSLVDELLATARVLARESSAGLLAVRSSAVGEDSKATSFAGLHDTLLAVAPAGIGEAVRKCWASLWSDGAIGYRAAHALPGVAPRMAVVLQPLVDARASAVVFTHDPLTGSARLVISATWGLGEAIVSGAVEPDTWVLERDSCSIEEVREGCKQQKVVINPRGGTQRLHRNASGLCLSATEVIELASLALCAEQTIGGPADIEAALNGSCWVLLQARPITTLRSWQ
jgi:rifampicin phosphotransferase